MNNQDLLDVLSAVSFMISIANYNENLSQSDKDDMIQALNRNMEALLNKLEEDLEKQNMMLLEILTILKEERNEENEMLV